MTRSQDLNNKIAESQVGKTAQERRLEVLNCQISWLERVIVKCSQEEKEGAQIVLEDWKEQRDKILSQKNLTKI
jgi:hypothetical protein